MELLVFRATSALGAPEDWATEAGTAPVTSTDADPGGAAPSGTEASSASGSSGVGTLPESEFELAGVASRLRASGRYLPVAHIAWTQTASPWDKPVQIPVQSVGLNAEGITGTVALERGVYLHLVLDLRYAMSDPPAGLDAPPGTVFVLDESHRVRLKERNYFDHPAFGVIALVTSNQPPKQPPSR
ncbi:MAG TPA: CsiV family protein [Steroidobacteraceae bacterium]